MNSTTLSHHRRAKANVQLADPARTAQQLAESRQAAAGDEGSSAPSHRVGCADSVYISPHQAALGDEHLYGPADWLLLVQTLLDSRWSSICAATATAATCDPTQQSTTKATCTAKQQAAYQEASRQTPPVTGSALQRQMCNGSAAQQTPMHRNASQDETATAMQQRLPGSGSEAADPSLAAALQTPESVMIQPSPAAWTSWPWLQVFFADLQASKRQVSAMRAC